jgi:hypothetical protein
MPARVCRVNAHADAARFHLLRSAVDHDSIAAGKLQFLRHVARNQKQFAQKCMSSSLASARRGTAFFGTSEHALGLGIDVVKRNCVIIFPNDFGRNLARDDFSKIVMSASVSSAQRTIKPRPIGCECQFFSNEADNFLAQCVAGTRPCFRAAEMLHTKLQR